MKLQSAAFRHHAGVKSIYNYVVSGGHSILSEEGIQRPSGDAAERRDIEVVVISSMSDP